MWSDGIRRLWRRLRGHKFVRIPDDTRTYGRGGRWGHNITVHNARHVPRGYTLFGEESWRHTGWETPIPRCGDMLVVGMRSGQRTIAVFVSIEPCGDPRDMFFASSIPLLSLPRGEVAAWVKAHRGAVIEYNRAEWRKGAPPKVKGAGDV